MRQLSFESSSATLPRLKRRIRSYSTGSLKRQKSKNSPTLEKKDFCESICLSAPTSPL